MKKYFRLSVILLTLMTLMSSCVHQWPESEPTNVTLKFVFDRSMNPFDTLKFETKAEALASHDVRYVVEAYRMKSTEGYYRDEAVRQVYTKSDLENLDNEVVYPTIQVTQDFYSETADVNYVKDYFELEHDMFIAKYFRGSRRTFRTCSLCRFSQYRICRKGTVTVMWQYLPNFMLLTHNSLKCYIL